MIVRAHLVCCDTCGQPGPTAGAPDERHWHNSAVKARYAAAKAGWTRIPKWSDAHPNGADLCPRCATPTETTED
jgi:hypothetical protein